MGKKAIVIGAGFSGLSAACCLAKYGAEVTLVEKHGSPGGRARTFSSDGFTFDMGPSFYWMPDVFEAFFAQFGKTSSEYYELIRLDPSYTVYFGKNDFLSLPANIEGIYALFESVEKGSSRALERFLKEAERKYTISMGDLIYRPCNSIFEFMNGNVLKEAMKLALFQSMSRYVRRHFKHPMLVRLMEFPILFLGATPQKTPALYSILNYADMKLGTWYPPGGMYQVVKAMEDLAKSLGVEFKYEHEAAKIIVNGSRATGVETGRSTFAGDVIVSSADYRHTEQSLLASRHRTYSDKYWNTRTLAPSCLIFYLGINKKIRDMEHHSLFFDEDFTTHAREIYDKPAWPLTPLFYATLTSKTDPSVAPAGHDNLLLMMPIAPGLEDTDEMREKYYTVLLSRFEEITGQSIRNHVVFRRSYCISDFEKDYHAFKGNAYGLAGTLKQSAFLRPVLRSRKVKNLFFTGQFTVPGPGVPPCIISGRIAAKEALKQLR